jgi:hypothetical protein
MYLFQNITKCITLRDTCSFIHMFVFIYLYVHLIHTMYVKYVVGAINMLYICIVQSYKLYLLSE